MNTDISELSIIELKALVYDNLCQIEQCQANIKRINIEIQDKSQLSGPNGRLNNA